MSAGVLFSVWEPSSSHFADSHYIPFSPCHTFPSVNHYNTSLCIAGRGGPWTPGLHSQTQHYKYVGIKNVKSLRLIIPLIGTSA